MADQKSPKSEDGRGVPPAGESTAAETETWDPRLFPGGSPEAAKTHIGMNAVDRDEMWIEDAVVPGVKSTF
jgi:hypothetical protein